MNEHSLKDIYAAYIPSERECIVLLALYQRISSEVIEPYFTYETFREIAVEAYENDSIRTEDILRKLLDQFIEVSYKRYNGKRYALTLYATRFIELIFNQINNLRNRYSLSDSFYQFAQLDSGSIKSGSDLERWYQLSFSDSASRTIDDHIGGLNTQLKEYLKQLTEILRDDQQTIGNKIGSFADVFQNFSIKALDVQQTLQLRHDLFAQLTQIVDRLYERIEELDPRDADKLTLINEDYNRAKAVRENVRHYFSRVEDRLGFIIDKIRFAEEKLAELQSNFREYTRSRINLKKLLGNYLTISEYDKQDGTRFTLDVPPQFLVSDCTRFIEVKKFDFGIKVSRPTFIPAQDSIYFGQKQSEIWQRLVQQEVTNERVNKLLDNLYKSGYLDLSEQFWMIYEHERDLESAINTCFTVINTISSQKEFLITIEQTPQLAKDNSVMIWQMTVTKA